jgi:hypothetical protein
LRCLLSIHGALSHKAEIALGIPANFIELLGAEFKPCIGV